MLNGQAAFVPIPCLPILSVEEVRDADGEPELRTLASSPASIKPLERTPFYNYRPGTRLETYISSNLQPNRKVATSRWERDRVPFSHLV